MPKRAADIEIRARNRKLRRDLRQSEKTIFGFGQRAGKGLKSSFRASIGNLAALGSAGGLAAVGKEALDFERSFTRLGIQAGEGFDAKSFRSSFDSISKSMGVSRTQVLGMANAIVNLEGAAGLSTDKVEVLTKASLATGAAMDEMAGIAFALRNAFGIEETKEMEQALSAVIEAGKRGSVPLAEMNRVLQQQAQAFSRISATGPQGAAEFAAAVQVARKGFGSAAEVGTGIKAFISQLDTAERKLRGYGITVKKTGKDGRRTLRPMGDILDEIAKSRLFKKDLLADVFGSVEAREFVKTMIANREEFDKIVRVAGKSNAVSEDSAKFLESTAGRMDKTVVRLKAVFAEAFTPERLETVVGIAEILADTVAFVADNVRVLVAAWASFKALQIAVSLGKAATAASQLASAATGAADGLAATGAAGKGARLVAMAANVARVGGALTAAGAAGFALGTALDEALDLSGKAASALGALTGDATPEHIKEFIRRGESEIAAKKRAQQSPGLAGKTDEEIAQQRKRGLELSRLASRRRQAVLARAEAFAGLTPAERQARLAEGKLTSGEANLVRVEAALARLPELLDRIPDAVQAGLEKATVNVDGETVNKAGANTPSKGRSLPR